MNDTAERSAACFLRRVCRLMGLVGLAVAACVSGAPAQSQLRVTTHAASLDGQLANSHLIAGRTEGLLVDAQLTRSDAKQVVTMIERSRIKRLTVFITHAHPDHYLGLAEIIAAFPRARIFSNATTATAIARKGEQARRLWRQSLGDDVAERIHVPEVLRGPKIEIEGETFRVIDLNHAESELPSMLFSPERGWLFSGDVIFSGTHLRLDEQRPKDWRQGLDEVSRLDPITVIYPGHGEPGPVGLIERNRTYLTRFIELTASTANAQQLFEEMEKLYPAYRLPFLLRRAAGLAKAGAAR